MSYNPFLQYSFLQEQRSGGQRSKSPAKYPALSEEERLQGYFYRHSHAPVFPTARRFNESQLKRDTKPTPGPSYYDTSRSSLSHKGASFGSARRRDIWERPDPATRANTPPPSCRDQRRARTPTTSRSGYSGFNQYDHAASRSHHEIDPTYPSSSRYKGVEDTMPFSMPLATVRADRSAVTPSAADYNTTRSSLRRKGGVIAAAGRKELFGRKEITPGPGAYTPLYGF